MGALLRSSMTMTQSASVLEIRQNAPLKPYTTFKIGGPARYLCAVTTPAEVREAITAARSLALPVFVLGGGSNILVSDAGFDGLVLHPAQGGVDVVEHAAESVRLKVNAGEPWDRVVGFAVDRGWWGIENLSHIPGQSGAALVQNIGAYGQQLSNVLSEAEVVTLSDAGLKVLRAGDCDLGYRRSIFNSSRAGKFLIWSITLKLGRNPRRYLAYKDVAAYFEERGDREPSQLDIRRAVIAIRDRKFPYPREERGGNAGSFFKNPMLAVAQWESLETRVRARFGEAAGARLAAVRSRAAGGEFLTVPAALLIDVCGLRGFEVGGAQVNPSQPLVILNRGGGTADDVLRLAGHVRRAVYSEIGVSLEVEPELVGFSREEREHYLGTD